jgi:hypothetical protein
MIRQTTYEHRGDFVSSTTHAPEACGDSPQPEMRSAVNASCQGLNAEMNMLVSSSISVCVCVLYGTQVLQYMVHWDLLHHLGVE